MYAVIRTGGKQQKVRPGDVIEVEFIHIDPGSAVEFEPILVVDDDGQAHHGKSLGSAKVTARLLGDKKADKVKVFKYKNKSGYQRTQGHRQRHTVLEIEELALSPDKVARKPEKPEPAPEGAAKKQGAGKAPAKKPAAKKPAAKKSPAKAPAKKAGAKKTPAEKPPANKGS